MPFLEDHMGAVFEVICRDFMRFHAQEILEFPARTVGRVWAADYDLDVAGEILNGSSVYGECKWWKDPVGENILEHLLETSTQSKYGSRDGRTQYMLFSRSGFTAALEARAKRDGKLHLIGLERLLGGAKRRTKRTQI